MKEMTCFSVPFSSAHKSTNDIKSKACKHNLCTAITVSFGGCYEHGFIAPRNERNDVLSVPFSYAHKSTNDIKSKTCKPS